MLGRGEYAYCSKHDCEMEKRCVRSETCPGSKPMMKAHHLRQFPGDFYHSAYCPCMDFEPCSINRVDAQETEWSKKQWDRVQQLNAQMIHLQNKLGDHLKTKQRGDNL